MLIDPKHWPTLSRLLDEALEVPPEARERWLDSLPPADLMYKEDLRTLLRHGGGAETRDFLDILPDLKDAVAGARAAVVAIQLRPGTAVGPYVIEREIGSGGMGAVWLARRSDGIIKRPVALKLPHAGPHGRHLAERFASERDILAELAHPNIARLYDAGFSEDGQPFLALEYVAGAPLIEYCDQHRLDIRRRLKLFQQVLHAVQYAHGNLVIHRDLKPSNVIVGSGGRAMLLDFGIAKLIASDPREEGNPGGPAAAALTPDYASPEQIAGQSVTTVSDIYSLGVLLFELLTGERPGPERSHPSRSVLGAGAASARSSTIASLSKALSGDLDTIVLKAMKKSPAERYATADAFSEDIERYLEGEPIAARRGSSWYLARKFMVRHKASVVGSGVALLAVIATAAIALYEAHAAAAHARAAAAERDRALALSSRNEAVADFLNILITESAGSDKPVTIGDMLARSEALVSAEFRGNREHRAAVLDMIGDYYRTIGDEKRALRLLQDAYENMQDSPDADLRRKLTCDLALVTGTLGRVADAERMLDSVVTDSNTPPAQAAECLGYLADLVSATDAARAARLGRQALDMLRTVPNRSAALEAAILTSIGDAERLMGHSGPAERYLQQSLQQYGRAGRANGPDAVVARNNLAIVYDATGNPRRALELYDETLRTAARNDPAGLPPVVIVGNRARSLEVIGRYAEAREGYEDCVRLSIRGELPHMRVHCLLGLAWVSRELEDARAADRYLNEAAEIARTSVPADAPGQVLLGITRGRIALANNQLFEARRSLDDAVASGSSVYFRMTTLQSRAELNLVEGRLAEAESDARKSLSLARESQGEVPYSNRTGLSLLVLGRVLARKGDAAGSLAALRSAIEQLSNTVDAGHPALRLAQQLVQG